MFLKPFLSIRHAFTRILVFLSVGLSPLYIQAQKKLSLIVAVGDYSSSIGITSIASVNDIKFIKAALSKNGFSEKDMVTLVNSKATKSGILRRWIN